MDEHSLYVAGVDDGAAAPARSAARTDAPAPSQVTESFSKPSPGICLRLLRLREILGDKHADPPIPPMIPVSKATWYAGIQTGRYPKPVRLGINTVAWRMDDIARLVDQGAPS